VSISERHPRRHDRERAATTLTELKNCINNSNMSISGDAMMEERRRQGRYQEEKKVQPKLTCFANSVRRKDIPPALAQPQPSKTAREKPQLATLKL
jgi:hypothetical protein